MIHPDWLDEMVAHALRPEVGAVGAKLYYGNDRLQHGGVVLGFGGSAGHYFPSAPRKDGGYYSNLYLTRRVSAVTAACLVVRREVYEAVGGLDAQNLKIAYNDVDFCIRLIEAGYHIIWTPYAELYHHESASRGSDQAKDKIDRFEREQAYLQARWSAQLKADPFYNPNLDLRSGYPHLAEVSRRVKPWLADAAGRQSRSGQACRRRWNEGPMTTVLSKLFRRKERDPGLALTRRRTANLLRYADKSSSIIEIGPSFAPIAPRRAGWTTWIVDHLSREQLIDKYQAHDGRMGDIETGRHDLVVRSDSGRRARRTAMRRSTS